MLRRSLPSMLTSLRRHNPNVCLAALPTRVCRLLSTETADDADKHFESDELRLKLLRIAVDKYVSEFGWTTESLAAAGKELGYTGMVHGVCPRGPVELVEFVQENLRSEVSKRLEEEREDLLTMPIHKRIERGILHHLDVLAPYVPLWADALALQTTNPRSVCGGIGHMAHLCDDIWYSVGDQSTDFNWYTKRMMLAAVIGSTELFMINDHSQDFEDTKAFMRRRLGDVGTFNKLKFQATEALSYAASVAQILAKNPPFPSFIFGQPQQHGSASASTSRNPAHGGRDPGMQKEPHRERERAV